MGSSASVSAASNRQITESQGGSAPIEQNTDGTIIGLLTAPFSFAFSDTKPKLDLSGLMNPDIQRICARSWDQLTFVPLPNADRDERSDNSRSFGASFNQLIGRQSKSYIIEDPGDRLFNKNDVPQENHEFSGGLDVDIISKKNNDSNNDVSINMKPFSLQNQDTLLVETTGMQVFCNEFFDLFKKTDPDVCKMFAPHTRSLLAGRNRNLMLVNLIQFLLSLQDNSFKYQKVLRSMGRGHMRLGVQKQHVEVFARVFMETVSNRLYKRCNELNNASDNMNNRGTARSRANSDNVSQSFDLVGDGRGHGNGNESPTGRGSANNSGKSHSGKVNKDALRRVQQTQEALKCWEILLQFVVQEMYCEKISFASYDSKKKKVIDENGEEASISRMGNSVAAAPAAAAAPTPAPASSGAAPTAVSPKAEAPTPAGTAPPPTAAQSSKTTNSANNNDNNNNTANNTNTNSSNSIIDTSTANDVGKSNDPGGQSLNNTSRSHSSVGSSTKLEMMQHRNQEEVLQS